MPGFIQFITAVYLLIGLRWFKVFGNASPLHMAGLAFTAYGIHRFALMYCTCAMTVDLALGAKAWI
jgi:hypothetical protein